MERMRMRRAMALGCLVLLSLAFVTVGVPDARATTGMPVWVKGNWWTYALTNASSPAGGTGTGTLKEFVVGTSSVTVGGVTYSAYDVKQWLNVTQASVTYTFTGDTWFRTSDLSPVQATFSYSTVTFLGTLSVTITITDAPPQTIDWPLTDGATWSSTSTETTVAVLTLGGISNTTTTTSAVTNQYAVQTASQVTVPKGTFSANPLKQTRVGATGYTMTYWSWEVGNYAKQSTYSGSGSEQGSETLTDYSYTPPPTTSTENIFGLPLFAWLLIVVAVVVVVAGLVLMMRRKPKAPMMIPPAQPYMPPGAAPPPQEPYMPPQQPPSPPQP